MMNEAMHRAFTEQIWLARVERGLDLVDAAKGLGISPETLGDLESGQRIPRASTIYKVAQGYGIPVRELLQVGEAGGGVIAKAS